MDRKFIDRDEEPTRIEKRHDIDEDFHIDFERESDAEDIRLSIVDTSPSGFGAYYYGSEPPKVGSQLIRKVKGRVENYQSRWVKFIGESIYQMGLKKISCSYLMPQNALA